MVQISKEEAKELRSKGFEQKLNRSHSKSPKYYCVEDNDVISALNEIRKNNKATNLVVLKKKY